MRPVLAAGRKGDAPQAEELPSGHRRGEVGCVPADAAYGGDPIRRRVRSPRAEASVKADPQRGKKPRAGRERHEARNKTGRFFGRTKVFRRVATRHGKKPENDMGFVRPAALLTAP